MRTSGFLNRVHRFNSCRGHARVTCKKARLQEVAHGQRLSSEDGGESSDLTSSTKSEPSVLPDGRCARSRLISTSGQSPTAHGGAQWWPSTVRAVLASATGRRTAGPAGASQNGSSTG